MVSGKGEGLRRLLLAFGLAAVVFGLVGIVSAARAGADDGIIGIKCSGKVEPFEGSIFPDTFSYEFGCNQDISAFSIELTGKVTAVDSRERIILIAADSLGLLEAGFEIEAPERFDLKSVVVGRVYSATARRTTEGEFRLSGLSAACSSRAADRRDRIFGEQAY
jgi:hypothetical protein